MTTATIRSLVCECCGHRRRTRPVHVDGVRFEVCDECRPEPARRAPAPSSPTGRRTRQEVSYLLRQRVRRSGYMTVSHDPKPGPEGGRPRRVEVEDPDAVLRYIARGPRRPQG